MSKDNFIFYARLVMEAEVMKYITGVALNLEEAKLRFHKAVDAGKTNDDFGFFLVKNKEDEEFIGVAKLVQITENQFEVGYMLHPENWGKGYASGMVEYLIKIANQKQISELIGIVDPENPASIRVLTKFGFQLYETGRFDGLGAAFYKLELNNSVNIDLK